MNRLGTTVIVATHDLGLIAATPGAQLIRLENGVLVDPTGALKHPPGAPPRASETRHELLFVSEAERRLIPSSGVRGPVPLLIAIMTFVMVVVAAAGLALANTASVVKAGVEHRYSIQIADGAAKAARGDRRRPLRARVSRASSRSPPEDLRRTLERWLGPAGREADLPLPAIIDVDLRARRRSVGRGGTDRAGRARRAIRRPSRQPRAAARGPARPDPAGVRAGAADRAGQRGGDRAGGARRARHPSRRRSR